MFGQDVEFVIEGTNEESTLTFKVEGRTIQPERRPEAECIDGSIEATIKDFKSCFPEDRVTVTDLRETAVEASA